MKISGIKSWARIVLANDLCFEVKQQINVIGQKSPQYMEWISSDLIRIATEFIISIGHDRSAYALIMNRSFRTNKFNLLARRWAVGYFLMLFRLLDEKRRQIGPGATVTLEDNPLNRHGVTEYSKHFREEPIITWRKPARISIRLLTITLILISNICISLRQGVRLFSAKRKYMVMREALWGLYDIGGYHFHDDFMVDGNKIGKKDIILFTREVANECVSRAKACADARRSEYSHFYLNDLKIKLNTIVKRILPLYLFVELRSLLKEINSMNFSLYANITGYFNYHAIPYEKVFSNYQLISELGHNYFSASHIPEAIICNCHNTKYFLMHWSDNAVEIDKYLLSFLGCDAFLLWGRAHIQGVEGETCILEPIGYVFKRFINEANKDKVALLPEMGITPQRKIIAFFDESFGGEIKMTSEHFVNFWEAALKTAQSLPDHTVIIKPKGEYIRAQLDGADKVKYARLKSEIGLTKNISIIDPKKWSFIEAIGVADIVVTQGMTSSATIALICGKEGLYFDQAHYQHPFATTLKNIAVFDDRDRLINKVIELVGGKTSVIASIPEAIIRSFDAYPDDLGIERLRDLLAGKRKVGIVVQARMGSTRLPGKVLLPLGDTTLLGYLIKRLKKTKMADEIIIATTTNKRDDPITEIAADLGVKHYRGDENDVLARYYEAAVANELGVIVRITSDCPFADPQMIDEMITRFFGEKVDYLSNTLVRSYPRGFDAEVFSFEALDHAYQHARERYQREHVTPYIYEHMRRKNFISAKDDSLFRVTVDTQQDYESIKAIYDQLKDKSFITCRDVIGLLRSKPELSEINREVKQKALIT